MFRPAFVAFSLVLLMPIAALAQAVRAADPVLDAVQIEDILDIMAEESTAHGAALDQSMLQGQGGAGWAHAVATIHDPAVWNDQLRDAVNAALPEDQVAPILAFLTSDQGRRIVELELSARRALLDDAVEEASRERYEQMLADEAPLVEQVARFVEVNDLVDVNVIGALKANAAFLEGLQDGTGVSQSDGYLEDVWAQEPEIRDGTRDWLFLFLTMAYAPLPSGDLEAYIAFSESEAGQAFNLALFVAFDDMFVRTSRATGRALGRLMTAEDI